MFPVIVTQNAVAGFVAHHQALFVEFVSVAKADKSSLGEAEKVYCRQVVFKFEGQMIFFSCFLVQRMFITFFRGCCLGLNHILDRRRLQRCG